MRLRRLNVIQLYERMSYGAFLLLSMLPLRASAALNPALPPPQPLGDCVQVEGSVHCPLPTFKLLVDGLSTYRAELKICTLQNEQLRLDLNACNAKVAELSAQLPCPVPPAPPAPGRFIGGYALGILSAVAIASAVGFPLPAPVRMGLGLGGMAGIGFGMVLVLP